MTAPTLRDLAPEGHDLAADPYPVYAALRAKGPVHRVLVPGSGECWLVVTRGAARAALTDPRLRNDIRHSASWRSDGGHAIGRNMLQTDPPQHTRLRRLVAAHFTAGRIAALRPRIESVAGELLDALPERGPVDLVSRYALPLPVTVICDVLGVPDPDRARFHTWSNELVMPTSPEAATSAAAALTAYLTDLIEAKRDAVVRDPGAPDADLLGGLVAAAGENAADAGARAPHDDAPHDDAPHDDAPHDDAPHDGAPRDPALHDGTAHPAPAHLTAEELLGMAFLILVAGHETTVNLISSTVHALLAHPDQFALLRADPGLTAAAVEESLRYNSPVNATAFRFAAEALDLAGTRIPAGDPVLISLAAASRDPLHFPEPDRFDIRREGPAHLGFGHGLHHCLGAPLARVEATVALRLLLAHRPTLTLATDPTALTWRTSTLLRGLTALPLCFD
ncbi:cytochrome P450 family protein [Streptomyces acidicola]|uniref:Cytochrome P450 n=1 Tax=Streptomyces acidicola TaxID=2596892 RepID=A0A5N8WKR8_9ACTN|nr:cytochrome P450 [Streptomyces acidicola]MPY48063.1 cytochrome P450 [Streptomyces acidicola]